MITEKIPRPSPSPSGFGRYSLEKILWKYIIVIFRTFYLSLLYPLPVMPSSFKALCAIRQNVIFSYFSLRCFLLCIFFSDNFTEEQLIVKNPMTFSKLTMASITLNERPQKRWIHLFWRSRAKDRNLMKMFGDPDPMSHETKSLIICWIQLMMTF